jgi:ribosome-interacting GTPase 1
MLLYEDVQLQLIDLPPISADFMEPWMPNALVHADAALLVIDMNDPAAIEDVTAIRDKLAAKRVSLVAAPPPRTAAAVGDDELADPFQERLTTLLVANKSDLMSGDVEGELGVFRELAGVPYQAIAVSAEIRAGLDALGRRLFELLEVVRVYTKIPGHPPDKSRPFAVRRGDTVQDVARLVHRGLAGDVKAARIWGANCFPGQQVSRDHALADGDVVELHW